MTADSLQYEIGITLIKGIGPVLAKNLVAYLGSAEAVFKETQANLAKIPEIGPVLSKQIADQQVLLRAEKEITFIQKNNIQTCFYTSKNYPYRLKECVDAPIMLYFKGNCDFNSFRFVGVVGTRKMTDYGKDLCTSFVKDLAQLFPDTTIVSGLAYGADICAHKAALEAGLSTVGVLGHGLDRIYPQAHRATAVKMIEKGGLLTEYVTGTNPDRPNFVQRNRIVSGICDALVVIESGEKGGSLITANIAQSYNRDVFAFPGRVGDEHSEGCNGLIKTNKAALIENVSDFVSAMGWEPVAHSRAEVQPTLFSELTDEQEKAVQCLRKAEQLQLNQVAINMGIPVSKASALLLEMEFNGLVRCLPGNMYKLNK